MSAICKSCKKRLSVIIPGNYLCSRRNALGNRFQDVAAITDLGATRHRVDLDLAHDLGERVTCTASLRSI